mgnify:CR=1 FL=1
MNLKLERNLIFFDIESTGLNVIRDRIIQLAMIRYHKDGSPPAERTYLINPGIAISGVANGPQSYFGGVKSSVEFMA